MPRYPMKMPAGAAQSTKKRSAASYANAAQPTDVPAKYQPGQPAAPEKRALQPPMHEHQVLIPKK